MSIRRTRQPNFAALPDEERCPAAVDAGWMQAPTLVETGVQVPVVGTSFHQHTIAALGGGRGPNSTTNGLVTAQLVVVADGPYAGAVGVYVGGYRVGSIANDLLERYRPVVAALAEQGRPATCRAVIVGGQYDPLSGSSLNLGIALLQPGRPAPAPEDAPFLAPVCGLGISVSADVATGLDGFLNSRAQRHVRRCTGVLEAEGRGGWSLRLDGEMVGPLMAYSHIDLGRVQAAAAARQPLSCMVRVIREPARPLRVMADLPV